MGADAVINSAEENVTARLTELHGQAANALGQPRPDTDIYIDAAGVAAVINTTVESAKWGAKLVMVAVQKKSDAVDLGGMLRSELTLIASQGYPTEIFEVTPNSSSTTNASPSSSATAFPSVTPSTPSNSR